VDLWDGGSIEGNGLGVSGSLVRDRGVLGVGTSGKDVDLGISFSCNTEHVAYLVVDVIGSSVLSGKVTIEKVLVRLGHLSLGD
jgi:hypothetical protein